VIQHVIEHGISLDRERIVKCLRGDVLKYAQHKFASNVIEKCLICGTTEQKNILIDEVCNEWVFFSFWINHKKLFMKLHRGGIFRILYTC